MLMPNPPEFRFMANDTDLTSDNMKQVDLKVFDQCTLSILINVSCDQLMTVMYTIYCIDITSMRGKILIQGLG